MVGLFTLASHQFEAREQPFESLVVLGTREKALIIADAEEQELWLKHKECHRTMTNLQRSASIAQPQERLATIATFWLKSSCISGMWLPARFGPFVPMKPISTKYSRAYWYSSAVGLRCGGQDCSAILRYHAKLQCHKACMLLA